MWVWGLRHAGLVRVPTRLRNAMPTDVARFMS